LKGHLGTQLSWAGCWNRLAIGHWVGAVGISLSLINMLSRLYRHEISLYPHFSTIHFALGWLLWPVFFSSCWSREEAQLCLGIMGREPRSCTATMRVRTPRIINSHIFPQTDTLAGDFIAAGTAIGQHHDPTPRS